MKNGQPALPQRLWADGLLLYIVSYLFTSVTFREYLGWKDFNGVVTLPLLASIMLAFILLVFHDVVGTPYLIALTSDVASIMVTGATYYNGGLTSMLYPLSVASIIAPVVVAPFARKYTGYSITGLTDKSVIEMAKKYGGVITKSVLAYEGDLTLEEAENALKRFQRHGVAIRISNAGEELYDIPASRTHLLKMDRELLNSIIEGGGKATRSELLRTTNFTAEALDEATKRLEIYGMIVYNREEDSYALRGVKQK